jgi:hypothetical protein
MNCLRAWMLPVLSIVTLLVGSQDLLGQGPPPGMGPMPPGMGPMGPGSMGPGPGMMGPGPGMMGPGPGMYDPGAMGGGGMMGGGDMGCPPGYGDGMGGGYGGRPGHNGLLGDILGIVLPYPDGGCAAPRWYDFELGAIRLTREDSGFLVPFASQGVGGPIVLDTDDLEFDESTSFKFSAMMQWGPGSNLEFTFFGLFGWSESASFTDPNGLLFSPFSRFGTDPLGGFVETDGAFFAGIDYYSTFDSYEVNFRQRWQSPNCRYQGSWLVGVRYFQLDEDFNYTTRVDGALAGDPDTVVRSNVNTNNCMTGVQVGGDLWICLLPGLRVGGEGKFAVLGNHANIDTSISVTSVDPPLAFSEEIVVGDVSFLGDLAVYATYRLNYNWTAKMGYQVLYLEGAALASENFNRAAPVIFAPAVPPMDPLPIRQPIAQENGNVFYHGFTATLEYMW